MKMLAIKMNKYLSYILFTLISSSLINCASGNLLNRPNVYEPEEVVTSEEVVASEEVTASSEETKKEYILQAGDVIDVKFFYNPELDELVTIRPDGRISLQLVDEVEANNLTPSELDQILTEKYSTILHRPEITVIVKEFAAQEIFVGGEVMRPGVISWNRDTTALRAIFQAGGFKETARTSSVIIVSKGLNNEPVARQVSLKKVISTKAPGPQVYVPKTFIAKANKFVRQYIKNMIPATLSVGFSYAIVKDRWIEIR
jgi:protein involved in polysaccharide export with SLBB domain